VIAREKDRRTLGEPGVLTERRYPDVRHPRAADHAPVIRQIRSLAVSQGANEQEQKRGSDAIPSHYPSMMHQKYDALDPVLVGKILFPDERPLPRHERAGGTEDDSPYVHPARCEHVAHFRVPVLNDRPPRGALSQAEALSWASKVAFVSQIPDGGLSRPRFRGCAHANQARAPARRRGLLRRLPSGFEAPNSMRADAFLVTNRGEVTLAAHRGAPSPSLIPSLEPW
jgi:hypothetical protein